MKLNLLRAASLSVRLPLLVIASAVVAALAVGVNSHYQSSAALATSEKDMASNIAKYRASVLIKVGENFETGLRIISESPAVREAYDFLRGVYEGRGVKDDSLHRHYVQRPVPAGASRSDYLGQDDRSGYAIAHRRWHPMLKSVAHEKKLYDLFLISPNGDVVYTVEKEADFATNLRTGPWRASGLARAFEGALTRPATAPVQFEDFEAYAPSNGAPAAFAAAAMRDEAGSVIGVIAMQLPDNVIARTISTAFGKDGMVYALGPEGRLRHLIDGRAKLPVFSETPHAALVKSMIGKSEPTMQETTSFDGVRSFLTIAPVPFMGRTWYLTSDLAMEAIDREVRALAVKNALIGAGLVGLISILAVLLTRGVTRSMREMRDAVGRIAAGENCAIPGETRTDELGDLARSLKQVHEAGVAAAQIKAGLDNASANVMITDTDNRVIYANKALVAFLKAHGDSFRKQFPGFSAEQIVGATLDQFHRDDAWRQSTMQTMRIRIDELTIEINVNPIVDADGARIGTIAEWRNLTADLAAMAEVTDVVEAAVKGDFSGRIREDDKLGAVRDLAAGQNRINAVVEQAMEEFSETLRLVAEGDLVIRVSSRYQGRFAQLAGGINDTISRLAETVATIQRATRDLNRAAGEINAGATDLAKRTEEEASSLEETAATTEELAASVKQTADNSRVANELSDRAKEMASEGGAVVRQAIQAMERIEEASTKITDIISVIDDIAFQTNLLALNAAVEAARAGDAGKGFAVVASEVRTLAQRSGQAARDIKELIVGSAAQVVDGVKLVHETGTSLDGIVSASREVAQMIGMIHAASSEQAHGIEEMSSAVARIDEMTQQNSALAEESAASASELIRQLERLNALVAAFRIDPSLSVAAPQAQTPVSEPDRLRQLAAEAFAQSRVSEPRRQAAPAPAPAPQRIAAGGSRGGQEWTEF